MRSLLALLRRQSLRLRVLVAFVSTAVLLAVVLSAATFFAVRSFLTEQRITSTTRQTILTLSFAHDFLSRSDAGPEELVVRLQARGVHAMVTVENDWYSTDLSLTPVSIPPGLRAVAVSERAGYEIAPVEREPSIVYGAPLPPSRTELYLVYPLADLEHTMSVLQRVLLVAGLAVVALSAVSARKVSAGLVKPLKEVSAAAHRVAEGLLETRVQPGSQDELGTLAASFNEMASALQQMIDRERRFVANASHELRTPLSTLRTAGELLASHRDRLTRAQREAVDLITEDVANLSRLVEELMEISEADAGQSAVRWEQVDLLEVAAAVVRRNRWDAEVLGEKTIVGGDKLRLERIVTNLLGNAYEHGQGKGVTVTVRQEPEGGSLRVADCGPGVANDERDKIFDRFYKADRSRGRDSGGIGLGLAIASENARLLGGSLEVSETHGGGATFTLRLRRSAPEREEVEA